MSKITRSTIKSFIKKNKDNLYISNLSDFDGMIDCVRDCRNTEFRKVEVNNDPSALTQNNTLGVRGAWFVGSSRDLLTPYDKDDFKGYEVSNCCGNFILAVKKSQEAPFTPSPISYKDYQCDQCGFVKKIETNHFGECYGQALLELNMCPKCSWKHPKQCIVWKCLEVPNLN